MNVGARKQAISVFTVVAVLIGLGVILQLWLLTASLQAILSGTRDTAIAGAGASAVLFAVNAGLLAYVLRVDRGARRRDHLDESRRA